jgi:hypothetical protein
MLAIFRQANEKQRAEHKIAPHAVLLPTRFFVV